jgi:hypothetical protein
LGHDWLKTGFRQQPAPLEVISRIRSEGFLPSIELKRSNSFLDSSAGRFAVRMHHVNTQNRGIDPMRVFFDSNTSEPGPIKPGTRSLSLRARFFLGTALILLIFCSICAYFIYRQGVLLVEASSHDKSRIVMAAVEANMNYVRDVLRPRIYDVLGKDAFVLEAMSTSFISRSVMERFNAAMPEYRYRRVAVQARNPAFEANWNEARMIRYFSANPDKNDWRGIMQVEGESLFLLYRPVRFVESCMRCHGSVEEAPESMVELYGSERGYNHKPGDLAGVLSVGIPVDVALSQLKGKAVSVFMSSLFVGSLLYIVIISFFNRIVARDLSRILDIFRKELPEDVLHQEQKGEEKPDVGLGQVPKSLQWADELKAFEEVHARDEIDEITIAAGAMAERLRENRKRLEEYAGNLERMVDERTRSLHESEERLREQVIVRNRELQTLNALAELTTQARTLSEILPKALERTLALIPAKGAGLYLLGEGASALELHCRQNAHQLAQTVSFDRNKCLLIHDMARGDESFSVLEAACGHISYSHAEGGRIAQLHIPLCCRGRILGVISFLDVDFEEIDPRFHALLSSIGRQVGIAVESLQNAGKPPQSKEVLQS